jgi:CubicO group peptidase (beta-lactamase class C family)
MSGRPTLNDFDAKKIDAIFAPFDQCHAPGAAVGIAVDGVPVYRKGFGRASVELPVLLSPSMRMRIGSTTKHMAALALMLLCEEGRAALDDEIGKYLPELNEASRHVTLRHLMSHTSGIRDVYQLSMFMHGFEPKITDAGMLDYYRTIDDVEFAPRESWSYNNGGYLLVTAAIERITGQSLDEVLSRRIFQPLGMYDTQLRRWDGDSLPNSASLHMVDGKGGYRREGMGMELTGAGGIVSTMDDMLRWLRHMDSPVVGSAETWQLMKTPQRLVNGTVTAYGFGLVPSHYRGVETLSHPGGVIGGNSQMIKVPSVKLDIAIAVNRADANSIDLAYRVIDACLDGLEPAIPSPLATVAPGIFLSQRTGRIVEILAMGESRFVAVDAGMPMEIVPDRDQVWRLAPMFSLIKLFLEVKEGSLRFSDFGNEDVLERIDPAEAPLGPRAGEYRCEPIDVTAHLLEEGEQARLRARGRHGAAEYDLRPLTPHVWQAKSRQPFSPLAGVVTFEEGREGFVLTGDRMKRLCFEHVRACFG